MVNRLISQDVTYCLARTMHLKNGLGLVPNHFKHGGLGVIKFSSG